MPPLLATWPNSAGVLVEPGQCLGLLDLLPGHGAKGGPCYLVSPNV
jgi:hypothetical protein